MSGLFNQLIAFYESINWPMEQVGGDTILSITYAGKNDQWVFVASTDEANGIVVMFARAPLACPPEKYAVMSEFLERANFGMTHGAWVMDRTDGEIRYRVGVDLNGLELTNESLRNLTLYTNMTMDHYLPGLHAVIEGGASALEAFATVFPEG
ncbi:MAG TPA: YbjN domain-containing protein [Anaerolineae bacterium]|nr:YbjN domain-containing protein [Anaerolineae bacterium]HMR65217.1 YbjN domain-containing protein [Anaerolineae bacterium]